MTLLWARPVNVRLAVAHLVTSTFNNPLEPCNPGSTVGRLLDYDEPDSQRYAQMWESIHAYYNAYMTGMTDGEILNQQRIALNDGTRIDDTPVTPTQMIQTMKRWNEYGWDHYETKRAGKLRVGRQLIGPCLIVIGTLFGVSLPSTDA